jgi:hypothetical protein
MIYSPFVIKDVSEHLLLGDYHALNRLPTMNNIQLSLVSASRRRIKPKQLYCPT